MSGSIFDGCMGYDYASMGEFKVTSIVSDEMCDMAVGEPWLRQCEPGVNPWYSGDDCAQQYYQKLWWAERDYTYTFEDAEEKAEREAAEEKARVAAAAAAAAKKAEHLSWLESKGWA